MAERKVVVLYVHSIERVGGNNPKEELKIRSVACHETEAKYTVIGRHFFLNDYRRKCFKEDIGEMFSPRSKRIEQVLLQPDAEGFVRRAREVLLNQIGEKEKEIEFIKTRIKEIRGLSTNIKPKEE